MRASEYTPWTSAIAGLLGLWAMAAPILWSASGTFLASNVAAGVIVAALGGFVAYQLREGEVVPWYLPAVAFLAGIWLIAAPFVFEVGGTLLYSNVAAGVLVALLTAFTLYAGSEAEWLPTSGRPTA